MKGGLTMKGKKGFCAISLIALMPGLLSCSGGGGGGGGGGGSCDTIANPGGPAYFKVINKLSTGLQWSLDAYPLGADMKPGECTIMGVAASQYTASLQQCNIGDAACTSFFGQTKLVVFSVSQGDTYTLEVNSTYFK
jgi:hypothetical protein